MEVGQVPAVGPVPRWAWPLLRCGQGLGGVTIDAFGVVVHWATGTAIGSGRTSGSTTSSSTGVQVVHRDCTIRRKVTSTGSLSLRLRL